MNAATYIYNKYNYWTETVNSAPQYHKNVTVCGRVSISKVLQDSHVLY